MSIKIMTEVWEHSQMKGSLLLLLLAIADFANDDGIAYPGTPTLAKKIRMSERQVKRLRQKLYDAGELEYISGGTHKGDRLTVRVTSCPKGDKLSAQRVTNRANKGDKSGKLRVTRMSPEPSLEPSIEPSGGTTSSATALADTITNMLREHYKAQPFGRIRNHMDVERLIDEHIDLVQAHGWEVYVRGFEAALQYGDARYASNIERQIVRNERHAKDNPNVVKGDPTFLN